MQLLFQENLNRLEEILGLKRKIIQSELRPQLMQLLFPLQFFPDHQNASTSIC